MTDQSDNNASSRRPLKSRGTGWAGMATRALLATPITPNQVSMIGVVFAGVGAWAMLRTGDGPAWWWLLAALGIQLRLLANMLDGLVAVEGGRGGPTGALYNELPDRVEDTLLLVAAGYAAGEPWLGWLAAVLAVTCAYVRAVGASLGLGQDFRGPMAKPHRMAALSIGALLSAGLGLLGAIYANWLANLVIWWTLALIAGGTVLTIARRTWRMHSLLSAKAS